MFRAGDRRCGRFWEKKDGSPVSPVSEAYFVLEGGVVGFAGCAFEGVADRVEAGFRLLRGSRAAGILREFPRQASRQRCCVN